MTEDRAPLPAIEPAQAVEVIVAFIRSQLEQAGFDRLVIGLSGGVDSATVAFLAARAIGPDNLLAVRMPYRTSSEASETDALRVVEVFAPDGVEASTDGRVITASRAAQPTVVAFRVEDADGGAALASLYVPAAADGAPYLRDDALSKDGTPISCVVPLPQHAASTAGAAGSAVVAGPQQAALSSVARFVEQTPVSGSSSRTSRAAVQSPSMAATTERACSKPVASRKVGARP